jgi:metal-responsive CopG/Arc/MetJ family transcriptional regulator
MTASSVPLTLPRDLMEKLQEFADQQGISVSELCEAWIRAGLRQLEEAGSTGTSSVGRCSVRTLHSSEGPVPLPLQQGTNT